MKLCPYGCYGAAPPAIDLGGSSATPVDGRIPMVYIELEESEMNDLEQEVQKIEKGDAWEQTDEVVEVEVRRPLDKVIPVRLSSDKWEELRREARELGVGPTTLARMWILEKLRHVVLARKSA